MNGRSRVKQNIAARLQESRTQLVLVVTVVVWILALSGNRISPHLLPYCCWCLAGGTAVVWAGVFDSVRRAWLVMCSFFATQPVLLLAVIGYEALHVGLFGGNPLDAVVDFFYWTTIVASSPCGFMATAALEDQFLIDRSIPYAGTLAFITIWQWYLIWEVGVFVLRRWKSGAAGAAFVSLVVVGVAFGGMVHIGLLVLKHD